MKKNKVRALVSISMLSSIAYILMLLNFPIPPFPDYLKIDFSDVPALIAALIFGPAAGILVEFFKNLLNYFMTGGSATGVPVGHMANFIAGILFVLPSYYIYNKLKSKRGLTFALVAGTFSMAIIMSILNYFVILPAYTFFLNSPAMTGTQMRSAIVLGILPFNLVKGIVISAIFILLFSKMKPWIQKQASFN